MSLALFCVLYRFLKSDDRWPFLRFFRMGRQHQPPFMMSAIALTRYFTGTSAWNHERASRFCLRLLQKTALRLFLSSSLLSTTCSPMFLAIPLPPTHATHLQYCACVWCSSRSLLLGCTLQLVPFRRRARISSPPAPLRPRPV